MLRSLVISWGAHLGIIVVLLVMTLVSPPRRPKKPTINVRIMTRQPEIQATPRPEPVRTPAPTTRPTPAPRVKSTPRPEPKKPDPFKKRVADINKEVVRITPTPTPEPTPKRTPQATATPKPKPERTATPRPTPIETPKPEPTPAMTAAPTPAPTVVAQAPRVPVDSIKPADKQSGPISTDNSMVQQLGAAYSAQAIRNIQQNFRPPYTSSPTDCIVKIRIQRDGSIENPIIVKSTNRPDLDQAAVRALKTTGRLPPLYDSFRKTYIDVELTFDFRNQP